MPLHWFIIISLGNTTVKLQSKFCDVKFGFNPFCLSFCIQVLPFKLLSLKSDSLQKAPRQFHKNLQKDLKNLQKG